MTHTTDAPTPITPGFIVLQGNRLEGLRDLLVEWLNRYPLEPLENETLLVQSNGMAQWLRLALGRSCADGGLGVATALEMLLPARLQWLCYRAVLGRQAVPPEAPLDKPRLAWRLFRLLRDPRATADPVFEPLHHYIDGDEFRAWQLATRLADQFDQYQVYRADWLASWAEGEAVLPGPLGDAPPVPDEARWQPALWRAILDDLLRCPPEDETGAPLPAEHAGRALVHRAFLDDVRSRVDRPADLPRRIVVFGLSALPPQVLEVLGAVARWTQVIVCVQNPCRHYWGDIVEDRHLFRGVYRRVAERKIDAALDEHDLHQHAHPLLASWGKQGRDLVRLVDEHDQAPDRAAAGETLSIDLFETPRATHLLGRIQADLLELVSQAEIESERREVDPQDDSLRFTVAHTPLREVEILQDQLLAAFDADPTLRPRDVIVMVPDMADYAPAIGAVFGRIGRDDPRWLPFAISDRPERETHPMLRALEALLHLPESRLAASEVMDLLEVDALRARFGIAAEDLSRLHHWIETAGIRWGIDGAHRHAFGLPEGVEQNSWRFGLDRLLYAHLAGVDADWCGIVPVAGLDGGSAEAIGPLHALLDGLDHWRARLGESRDPAAWVACFEELVEAFFDPEAIPREDGANPLTDRETAISLRDRVLDATRGWLADCRAAAFEEPIGIETARSAWLERLDEHRLSQRFLVGSVNFATLMPMRAIPFRQVYLLGMSDAAYPRRRPSADFDLMAGRYRPGDRSRREDDRYLFLEALLSARDRFWISWVGRDVRDNHETPASVLVNQLRDHVDRGWSPPPDRPDVTASQALTTEHPLQPFSRDYFGPERPELFSYAREWYRVHAASPAAPAARRPAPDAELPVPSPGDLSRLLSRPWRLYFGGHLDVPPRYETALPEDDEPFSLDPLEKSQLSRRLLDEVLPQLRREPVAVLSPELVETCLPGWIEAAFARIAGSGRLPLPPFDETLRHEHAEALARQLTTWAAFQSRYPDALAPLRLDELTGEDDLPRLAGKLDDIRRGEDGAVRPRLVSGRLHSRYDLKWYRIVGEWPAHLAAQLGGEPVTTFLISESDAHRGELTERPVAIDPVEPEKARALLIGLRELWMRATREPIAAEPRSQVAWVIAGSDDRRRQKAREGFEQATGYDAELKRLWPDFDALAAHPEYAAIADSVYLPIARATRGKHRKRLDAEEAE